MEAETETKQTTNADGSQNIEIMVKKLVNKGIASGDYDRSMTTRYGVKNKGDSIMVAWPNATYLPQFVDQDGYFQTTQDPLLRTDMDAGPMKVRLRYTAVPEQFTIVLTLTKAQLEYFVTTFFKNTLGYGVGRGICMEASCHTSKCVM